MQYPVGFLHVSFPTLAQTFSYAKVMASSTALHIVMCSHLTCSEKNLILIIHWDNPLKQNYLTKQSSLDKRGLTVTSSKQVSSSTPETNFDFYELIFQWLCPSYCSKIMFLVCEFFAFVLKNFSAACDWLVFHNQMMKVFAGFELSKVWPLGLKVIPPFLNPCDCGPTAELLAKYTCITTLFIVTLRSFHVRWSSKMRIFHLTLTKIHEIL